MKHMLTYHLGIPLALFVVLLVFGVPVGTAFGIGVAAGCVAMVFMGGQHRDHTHASSTIRRDTGDG